MRLSKLIFIFCIFIFSFNLVFSQDVYRLNLGETVEIDKHGVCHQVTNNGLHNLSIFTKFPFEWYSFNQTPPVGITFDSCGDGYIWVKTDGIYQSADGATYSRIYGTEGWHNTLDGDMVVINAKELRIDSGATLTTQYRCRGLLIYANEAIIDGTISMTGRGAKANPDDVAVTSFTPKPSGDGNAVPAEGLVIRRDKNYWGDITSQVINNANANNLNDFRGSHSSSDLFYGTGIESVRKESNQAIVNDGLVIKIPKVGGDGGTGVTHSSTYVKGIDGLATMFGTGGGGSGNVYHWDDDGCRSSPSRSGSGSTGTVFSGGSGGGGGNCGSGSSAQAFGGYAGSTGGNCHGCPYGVGGFGNGNGGGASWLTDAITGKPSGTGGLLILEANKLELNGKLESNGYSYGSGFWSPSWPYGSNDNRVLGSVGGGSGGGVVVALYRDTSSTVSPSNLEADSPYLYGGSSRAGITFTKGGKGSAIGPILIDSDCSSNQVLYDGVCEEFGWAQENDWTGCIFNGSKCLNSQTVECQTSSGNKVPDFICNDLPKPTDEIICDISFCTGNVTYSGNCLNDGNPPWPFSTYDCGSIGDRCLRVNQPSLSNCVMTHVARSYCSPAHFCFDPNGNQDGNCNKVPHWYVTCDTSDPIIYKNYIDYINN